MATSLLHDLDFYAWTQQQVDLLKSGNLVDVDFKHLIEEIESMGASERRELRETGLEESAFPAQFPYAQEDLLNSDFYPGLQH